MEKEIKEIFDKHYNEMIRTYIMEEKGVLDLKDFAYDIGALFMNYMNDRLSDSSQYQGMKVYLDKYKEFIIFEGD